jgi:hypothetical protein
MQTQSLLLESVNDLVLEMDVDTYVGILNDEIQQNSDITEQAIMYEFIHNIMTQEDVSINERFDAVEQVVFEAGPKRSVKGRARLGRMKIKKGLKTAKVGIQTAGGYAKRGAAAAGMMAAAQGGAAVLGAQRKHDSIKAAGGYKAVAGQKLGALRDRIANNAGVKKVVGKVNKFRTGRIEKKISKLTAKSYAMDQNKDIKRSKELLSGNNSARDAKKMIKQVSKHSLKNKKIMDKVATLKAKRKSIDGWG